MGKTVNAGPAGDDDGVRGWIITRAWMMTGGWNKTGRYDTGHGVIVGDVDGGWMMMMERDDNWDG